MMEKELKNSMNKWFFPGHSRIIWVWSGGLSRFGSSGHTPDHPALLGKNFKSMYPRI